MVTVKRDPKGVRYVRETLMNVGGKPVRVYRSFDADLTDDEVQRMADEWYEGIKAGDGTYVGRTLEEVLGSYLAEKRNSRKLSANTIKTYRALMRYTAPIAGMPVREVKSKHINSLYSNLMNVEAKKQLNANTVRMLHSFLVGAFKWMEHNGAVDRSPMLMVDEPKPDHTRETTKALGVHDLEIARAAIEDGMKRPGLDGAAAFAAWLGLNMGLRVGEACALRACDFIDGAAPNISVKGIIEERKSGPKWRPDTKSGHTRTLAITDPDAEVIRARIARCKKDEQTLVSVDGRIVRPQTVSRRVRSMLIAAGIGEWVHFHSLRHTHATIMLAAGVDLSTVSRRLGHSDPSITARVYAHALPSSDSYAAAAFAAYGRRD